MISLTAIITCKAGTADTVLDALVEVGAFVKANEPDTLGYSVVRSIDDPSVLITQELFKDHAAMQTHNEGRGSKAFFSAAEGLLEGVTIHIGERLFTI